MSLLDKILKNTTLKHTSLLSESEVFNEKDVFTTPVPAVNIALSASVTGGLTPGLLQIAGESKHFKSAFALLIAGSFMKANPDGVVIFYDSEFGTPESYFDSFNIDKERVVHSPITNVEEFKHDIMSQLEGIDRGDKVCIIVDSIGNLASLKEVEDTLAGKNTADMTRAKALKSLGRMITPHLTLKNIPMIAVNHIYKELGMFPKNIVSGGCLVFGTKIQTNDGKLININDVQEGQIIKTMMGPKIVTHVWNPETLAEGVPECYEVEFEDGHKITCSERHKFMIDDEWIEIQNISEGTEVKSI